MKWGFMDDYDHDSFDKDLLEEAKLIAEYLFLVSSIQTFFYLDESLHFVFVL